MAEITASMVKELRERTQAGMMACKKALTEAGGDMDKAREILQKNGEIKGQAAQAKTAAQGAIGALVSDDHTTGVLVELNCQTDFVARGEEFQALLKLAVSEALAHKIDSAEALNAHAVDGVTFMDRAIQLTARSGEKHAFRRVALITGSLVRTYTHTNAQIAVLVDVASSDVKDPRVVEFADDLTLQVASMRPLYLVKSDVPADLIAKQREILSALMDKEDADAQAEPAAFLKRIEALLLERAQEEGTTIESMPAAVEAHLAQSEKDRGTLEGYKKEAAKLAARPAATREKILDGKVAKWLTDVVLLDQTSIKENKKTVSKLQSEVPVKGTQVVRFARFEVGEGIEKAPTKNFAEEVAEMAGQHA